jgi:hypothetical protein
MILFIRIARFSLIPFSFEFSVCEPEYPLLGRRSQNLPPGFVVSHKSVRGGEVYRQIEAKTAFSVHCRC